MRLYCAAAAVVASASFLAHAIPDNAIDPLFEKAKGSNSLLVDFTWGSITGKRSSNVESFNAIPYAEPPVGPLRLRPPKAMSRHIGTIDGSGVAPACSQFFTEFSEKLLDLLKSNATGPIGSRFVGQEDCLTLNVQRPAGTTSQSKLPVLFWIYGGGFEFGSTNIYDGHNLVNFGASQGQPFLFVAVNYRLAGFGFMPGKEILADGSANIGLLDQRMALEWVADNVAAFGGDPGKVTIWGESAGAISVFDQMALYGGNITYKGKPLFRAAIMNSGSLAPADPVDSPKGQAVYDAVVEHAQCTAATNTLDCLRSIDYDAFREAVNSIPKQTNSNAVVFSYLPRPDGRVLPDSPDRLLQAGKYFPVPTIIGDQEDEGTLFALSFSNVATADKTVERLQKVYFQHAPTDRLKSLVDIYAPASMGSPFRTNPLNTLYPGFRRLAAILGDLLFTLLRRSVLNTAAKLNPGVGLWSYLASYDHGFPVMGTFHASDIIQIFFGIADNNAMRSCRTYYFNFLYNLDPNKGIGGYSRWPDWKENHTLMWFKTTSQNELLDDDFRINGAKWLTDNLANLNV